MEVKSKKFYVSARKGLLLDSQHPEGWEKMRELESRRRVARLEVEEPEITAPKFLTQLQGITTLEEGQSAHFEAKIEPLHDPTLRVEFFHNGKALQQASRIHTVCDFGYVALDIGKLVSADSGEYVCKAFNALGEARSVVNVSIAAKGSLDLSSQRPEGLDKIKQLESRGRNAKEEEITTFQKPVFTTALQNVVKSENQSAHLAARLIPVGDTSLTVEWYKDGKILETGKYFSSFFCLLKKIFKFFKHFSSDKYFLFFYNLLVSSLNLKQNGKHNIFSQSNNMEHRTFIVLSL